MSSVVYTSGHDDMIHDAVLDYYGRRLATCSSDKTIKIFEIEGDQHKLTETLKGHEGAVWCVSWAHPKYGTILASSSYDGKVLIWRETPSTTTSTTQSSTWTKVFDYSLHTASVNMVAWAPHELGCVLACASSDGNISVLEFKDNSWEHKMFWAHGLGANAVSWAPATGAGSLISAAASTPGQQQQVRRFVTAGSDNSIKIWDYSPENKAYTPTLTLSGHTDWVRDVSWSPTILSKSYIASASQDKTVRIWTSDSTAPNAEWKSTTIEFDTVLWRVSWSLSGNILAVSGGDNKVSLWKENLQGEWEKVKDIEE